MPATTAAGGWFWSFVFSAYCSCATYWTGLVVGRAYNANPSCDLSTYPRMAGGAFARLSLPPRPTRRPRRARATARSLSSSARSHLLPRHRHPDHIPRRVPRADLRAPARVRGLVPRRLDRYRARRADTNLPRLEMDRRPSLRRPRRFRVSLLRGAIFVVAPWDCAAARGVSSPDAVVASSRGRQHAGRLRRPRNVPGIVAECDDRRIGRGSCDGSGRRDGPLTAPPPPSGGRRRPVLGPEDVASALNFQDNRLNAASLVQQILQTPISHGRRHDHRRGTTRARNRTRIRGGVDPAKTRGSRRGQALAGLRRFSLAMLLASAFMSSSSTEDVIPTRGRVGAVGADDDLLLAVGSYKWALE